MREAPRHVENVGLVGATVAALCCIGVPAFVSMFVALGLGFLVNDVVLVPVLLLSLALIAWGLVAGWNRHHQTSVLIVAAGSAGLLVFASLIS